MIGKLTKLGLVTYRKHPNIVYTLTD